MAAVLAPLLLLGLVFGSPRAGISYLTAPSAASDLSRQRTGERFLLLEADGRVMASGSSPTSRIELDAGVRSLLRDPARHMMLLHNHPGGTSLSAEDITLFIASPGLTGLSAVTADGTIHTLTAARADAASIFLDRCASEMRQMKERLDPPSRFKTLADRILLDMNREGLVQYADTRVQ